MKPMIGRVRKWTRAAGPADLAEKCRDERRLVEALRRGEAAAVEELVDRYGSWIHRVTRRVLQDARDAEETMQDVLLTVVRKVQTFKGEAAFSSWIYRIAVNAALQRVRSRRVRAEVSLEPLLPVFDDEGRLAGPVADWSSQLEDPAYAAEARTAIDAALARLPAEYRIVALLRDVEGLSTEEVAAILDLTVPATKSRLHRARLALRQALADFLSPAR